MLVLALVAQTVTTRACPNDKSDNPSTLPSSDPFTTRDGARFRVDTVQTGLEVPWAMAFAPDGRLFVTERVGRVSIINVTTGAIDVALVIDGVYGDGEAGVRGLAQDTDFSQTHKLYIY